MDVTTATRLLESGLRDGLYSAATYAVAVSGSIVAQSTIGALSFAANAPAANPDTLFDIASLTKPVATASTVMHLVEEGRLTLGQQVAAELAPAHGPLPGLAGIDIKQLLTHTSGLPPIPREPDVTDADATDHRSTQLRAALTTPLLREPGLAYTYSDTGYMILWEATEQIAGQPLEGIANKAIFEPLAMSSTQFRPTSDNIAATIDGAVTGAVHDPRALSMGGITGHAGLFSTASDLIKFAEAIRTGGSPILSRATGARMAENQLSPEIGAMSYGWFVNGNDFLPKGDLFSDRSFGHSGFTGCLILIDPTYDASIILLTNRVLNTTVEGLPFLKLRRKWLNAVAAAITA
ncbi:MAG TPA: serine hydrolase [Capsulimonadaceae bacterium]|jgi:CubicO group peptidase (beta-lactamase class C family)